MIRLKKYLMQSIASQLNIHHLMKMAFAPGSKGGYQWGGYQPTVIGYLVDDGDEPGHVWGIQTEGLCRAGAHMSFCEGSYNEVVGGFVHDCERNGKKDLEVYYSLGENDE